MTGLMMDKLKVSPFRGIAIAVRVGTRLFLARGQEGLMVFDLRDGTAELVAHLKEFPAFDLVLLKDGSLAVAAGQHGVVVLDTHTLRPVRIFATDFPVHSVMQEDGHVIAQATTLSPLHARIAVPL